MGGFLYVSFMMAKRSADVLLDRSPPGIYDEIDHICRSVHGVLECKRARARVSGPFMFLDVVITVEEDTSIDEGHHIADAVERALSILSQHVDVMVHIEPQSTEDFTLTDSTFTRVRTHSKPV